MPGEAPDGISCDDLPSASVAVAKLRLELRHRSLSGLEEEGLVTCDRENGLVTKGPAFEEKKTARLNGSP